MSASNENGFSFLPLGAIIKEFRVGGINIVQGFHTLHQYIKHNTPHYGATIGRVANRIQDAVIKDLNGRTYTLAKNNGPNSLHGGEQGWDKKFFEGPITVNRNGKEAVLFKYLSNDGEEGYPGTVELRVWYTTSKEDVDSAVPKMVLDIEYEVEFMGDECQETVVNVTNHSYFNISGGPTIEGTKAQLFTNKYLPIDSNGIPVGKVEQFTLTDVTKPFIMHPTEPDIDDCFVMDEDPSKVPLDTRSRPLRLLAQFTHPSSGLHFEVHSTEPAFQFYTGRYINVPEVDGIPARGPGSGFCVEPSRFINAPNQPEWKHMTLLKRGHIYGSRIQYRAWREPWNE